MHRGSDIDLQLFCDDQDAPEAFFRSRGWPYQRDDVTIRRGNTWHEYQHIYLESDFCIELTIYPRRDLRLCTRSSTDGKPITRLTVCQVEALLAQSQLQRSG